MTTRRKQTMQLIAGNPGITLMEITKSTTATSNQATAILRYMLRNRALDMAVYGAKRIAHYTVRPGWEAVVDAYEARPHRKSAFADSCVPSPFTNHAQALIAAAMAVRPEVRTVWRHSNA